MWSPTRCALPEASSIKSRRVAAGKRGSRNARPGRSEAGGRVPARLGGGRELGVTATRTLRRCIDGCSARIPGDKVLAEAPEIAAPVVMLWTLPCHSSAEQSVSLGKEE